MNADTDFQARQNSPCKCGGKLGDSGSNDPANAVDEATHENFFRMAAMLYVLKAMSMAQRRA